MFVRHNIHCFLFLFCYRDCRRLEELLYSSPEWEIWHSLWAANEGVYTEVTNRDLGKFLWLHLRLKCYHFLPLLFQTGGEWIRLKRSWLSSCDFWDLHIKNKKDFFTLLSVLILFPFFFTNIAKIYNLWEWCGNTQIVQVVRASSKITKHSKLFNCVITFFHLLVHLVYTTYIYIHIHINIY